MVLQWIEERHADYFSMRYQIDKELFSGKSSYQSVKVVETRGHGKMLLNDDLVMISERDEFAYHDMIAHVPLFIHPHPKRVLIIGGGDGGTAREVLRHQSVESVTMVEIDKMVVDACLEHIEITSAPLKPDNPDLRFNLIIGDGVKYVKEVAQADNNNEKFDLILVDSTDPIGPATPLFGVEFYQDVYNALADKGVVVSQGESPWYEVQMQQSMLKILKGLFEVATIYNFANLTYPGGLWSFTFASKGIHPYRNLDVSKIEKSNLKFRYYNAAIHRAAFALPQFQLDALS